ncbi:replication protein O [Buttiauxella ferragutiae ATCC 51602]|uniref:Replication protein O n=1 Tax=Buttiauxella ferragutiae ATCC 51602 TaxID=1354252 RepID=A0ABX2W7S0_9ENTR|nr:conserved phage C-terminal domain-containing protein [Buttiauxella ferragutiae]OAT26701.1 replication protein O [Buttiauxella ferragutiae ATCC 51602]
MSALIKLLDRPVAYQPAFAQLSAGKVRLGPTAAVLLSQFVYWHNRMDGGWMYKTRTDIKKETGLSRDEQETARKRLIAIGVLEEDLRGVPATLHYKINSERLEELLLSPGCNESQLGATPPTRRRQPRQLDGDIPANKMVETPPTRKLEPCQQVGGDPANFPTGDYTESTQETTQRECQADEPPDDFDDPALRVLNHMNRTTGAKFQDGKTTMGFINGLLVGEYVADELILVIDHRSELWANDLKMSQYLCPKTLFSFENFEGYLPLARKWHEDGRPELGSKPLVKIDSEERDVARKRFLGSSVNILQKSVIEIATRKSAATADIKNMSPEAAKRIWDKLWQENAQRIHDNGKINLAST